MSRIVYEHKPGTFWRRFRCWLRNLGHRDLSFPKGRGVWVVCDCGWSGRIVHDESDES